MIGFVRRLIAVVLFTSLTVGSATAAEPALLGFSANSAAAERAREARFDGLLVAADQRTWMQLLTAHPHHTGSPYDADNARYLQALLTSFGFQAEIEQFETLFPTPIRRELSLLGPAPFVAKLQEPTLPGDPTSAQIAEALPLYNAYSRDGDVSGSLVYVNYGLPADYDELARHGVDVRGKIVIARYGHSWRGIKPKVAAERGAIGCIIYSDPRDDGFWQGPTYPDGVERNAGSGQRGSVADITLYPGDPSSPGVASLPGGPHLAIDKIATLTKIPVLPISAADATPLMAALDGPVAPPDWRGALPFTYHLGGGSAHVHLAVAFDWKIRPLYDVIARLPGSRLPDQWVLRGNHHDAWVSGAEDPIAGTVALLAEAKAVGALARTGDRPKRTLIYTIWDGEEPGWLGSTAWVEAHAAELANHAAIYVNTDTNDRGELFADGSPALQNAVAGVAADVTDPERGISVLARQLAAQRTAAYVQTPAAANDTAALHLGSLGAGSDFSAFISHAGIATLNVGYGGEDDTGSYHSAYDSFAEFTRLKDGRDFAYGVALAKTAGRIVLRFADSDALPYAFAPAADTFGTYVNELKALLADERRSTARRNALIADGSFIAACDPRVACVAPPALGPVPELDFGVLDAAVARLHASAAAYDGRHAGAVAADNAELDAALIASERALLGNGLPHRPWYRHEIDAPGSYTGYTAKTMPAIREPIEARDWPAAQAGIVSVSAALQRYADAIDRATAQLK